MTIAEFFARGHAVDLVLAVMALEFAWLTLRPHAALRRPGLVDRGLAFLPGVFILLAVRAALTGAGWPWVALMLAASFPFHIADVLRRRL